MTDLDNPCLFCSLIKDQLLNLCIQKNHRSWSSSSKAVFWYEYFHNKTLGSCIYKLMPCYNTVKKFFEKRIEEYYLALTNIDFIGPILSDMIQNVQNNSIIPNLQENSNFEIYCTVGLDACKISNPFIPSEQTKEKNIGQNTIIIREEMENLKKEINFIDVDSLAELSHLQILAFIKIIENARTKSLPDAFLDIDFQKKNSFKL